MNELIELIDEMRGYANRHWMHDEGQYIRYYTDRLERIAKTMASDKEREDK